MDYKRGKPPPNELGAHEPERVQDAPESPVRELSALTEATESARGPG